MIKEIRFDEVTLHTESFGNPENPAILLIMGAMCSMIWWETPFCELLAEKGFFVIRYDNRDTGRSTCYPPGKPEYTFEDLADDAIRVLDGYGTRRAAVMGMSMGGMLTQMLALRHPQRLRGIVLLASMYFAEGADELPYSTDEVNAFFAAFEEKPSADADELAEDTLRQWMVTGKSSRPKDRERIRALARIDVERAMSFASRANPSHAQVTGEELSRIAEIKMPALVVHGTEDAVIPYIHGEMLAKTIPNAVLHTMEGAGHELHPLDFEAVAERIADQFVR